jgi:tight adherence protein B
MPPGMAVLLAGGAGLLLLAAAVLMLGAGGGADRKLRQRVAGLRPEGGSASNGPVPPMPSIRMATPEESGPVAALLRRLGHDPHVLRGMALPMPVVLGAALLAGGLAFWRAADLAGPLGGTAAALLVAGGTLRGLFRWQAGRHRDALFRQIPDAIGLIVRAIRAGLPMAEALRNVAAEAPSPTREQFARVVGEIAIGRPVDATLWNLYARTQLTEYAFFAVTLGLQSQTGGSLAETLDNLADMVRKRVALAGRARALSAEARMSALVLVALPVVTGLAISVMVPGYMNPLFNTELGRQMLMSGAALLVFGLLVIRSLIRSATRD